MQPDLSDIYRYVDFDRSVLRNLVESQFIMGSDEYDFSLLTPEYPLSRFNPPRGWT